MATRINKEHAWVWPAIHSKLTVRDGSETNISCLSEILTESELKITSYSPQKEAFVLIGGSRTIELWRQMLNGCLHGQSITSTIVPWSSLMGNFFLRWL